MIKMEENKQLILDQLLPALQKTRALHDLVNLQYDLEKELVHAVFAGGEKIVNVSGDSGTAMILDVVTHIR